jgi:hypothetical protein
VSHDELDRSDPPRLARILQVSASTPEVLSTDELGTILRHQLGTPLTIDLADPNGPDAANVGEMTFGELLAAERPPLDLLERVRRFAKVCKARPDGPLPAEVGTVLYFASIVKARVACGARISTLNDADVNGGVRWALQQAWVFEPLRQLFEAAEGHVSARDDDSCDDSR